jgi:anti-anti-sigma regulatory factor
VPHPMFRIHESEGHAFVTFSLSGRIQSEQVAELRTLLESEHRRVVLDLQEVALVDRDAVQFLRSASRMGLNSGIVRRTCTSGSSKSDLEAMAKTIDNSNRCHGECRGSVGISTGSDIATRHLVRSRRQKKKLADSEPASSSLFLLRCSTHINRYSKKSNPLAGWLNVCCFITQIHRRGIRWGLPSSTNVSDPSIPLALFPNASPLQWALFYIFGALKKAILIITN